MTKCKVFLAAAIAVLSAASVSTGSAVTHHPGPYLPLCSRISLTASYLAEVGGETGLGKGPGFVFVIKNDTNSEVRLAVPVPSSSHWYAHVGERWLWRASSGSGGSLVDADREKGEVFAYQPKELPQNVEYMTVPAHGTHEWTESMRDHPEIAYRPGCAICNNPGEREYRAVFAYAYVPHPQQHEDNLLTCGLRSMPVVMPPLPDAH